MKINESLKKYRRACGLTQEQVAQQLNVTRQTVSSYEAGRTEPGIDILMQLAKIYGVEIGDIIGAGETGQNDSADPAEKRLKWISVIGMMVFLLSVLIASAVLCWDNRFLPREPDNYDLIFKLLNIRTAVHNTGIRLFHLWVFVLCLLEIKDGVHVKFRSKLLWYCIILVGILAISLPFYLLDPLYSYVEYVIYPVLGLPGAFMVTAVGHIVTVLVRFKRKGTVSK